MTPALWLATQAVLAQAVDDPQVAPLEDPPAEIEPAEALQPDAPTAEPAAEPTAEPAAEPDSAPDPLGEAAQPVESGALAVPHEPMPATQALAQATPAQTAPTDNAVIPEVGYSPRRPPPRFEVGVELGSLNNSDRSYDLFASGNGMGSRGIRLGYRLAERLQLVASWHHIGQGARVELPSGEDYDYDFDYRGSSFVAALLVEQFSLGARVDVAVEELFLPYLTVQGTAMQTTARLDDDPTSNTNLGQVQEDGVGLGVLALAGAEVRMPAGSPVQFALHTELGYGLVAPIELGSFGSMQPGGFAARGGVGLRF